MCVVSFPDWWQTMFATMVNDVEANEYSAAVVFLENGMQCSNQTCGTKWPNVYSTECPQCGNKEPVWWREWKKHISQYVALELTQEAIFVWCSTAKMTPGHVKEKAYLEAQGIVYTLMTVDEFNEIRSKPLEGRAPSTEMNVGKGDIRQSQARPTSAPRKGKGGPAGRGPGGGGKGGGR
jgi:hypothetical protein